MYCLRINHPDINDAKHKVYLIDEQYSLLPQCDKWMYYEDTWVPAEDNSSQPTNKASS